MMPQERHEDVVRRYPGGLNGIQFRHETLASADENGILDPPALADWFKQQSMLLGMSWDGLIERTGPEKRAYEKSGPWRITEKGRAFLADSAGNAGVSVPPPNTFPSRGTDEVPGGEQR